MALEVQNSYGAVRSWEAIPNGLCYFHSYPVVLNFWRAGSYSDSSAIIKLFIQDKFCEFENPATDTNPLTLPSSISLLFSCPHHMNWSPCSVVVSVPIQLAWAIPWGYWVIVPEPMFLLFGNLPIPLISDVKLTSIVVPSIGWTLVILKAVISPLSSKSFSPSAMLIAVGRSRRYSS